VKWAATFWAKDMGGIAGEVCIRTLSEMHHQEQGWEIGLKTKTLQEDMAKLLDWLVCGDHLWNVADQRENLNEAPSGKDKCRSSLRA